MKKFYQKIIVCLLSLVLLFSFVPNSVIVDAATRNKTTTSISKVQSKAKGFKVTWKKKSKVKGYQIQYSTSKKFTKSKTKTKTVSSAKTTSATISKLSGCGKKYYVRIRTYTVSNGKRVYSAWSSIKTVTTAKHKYEAATCTEAKTCKYCGKTSGKALGHKWKASSTCSSAKTCTVCKKTTGHKWKAATCTKAKTCTVCKKTTGKALGHKWKAATCTKAKTCTVCKKTTGKALGHKWKAATCSKAKTCTVCKKTTGKALGHKWQAATCTTPKTCTVCKKTTGKALGHKFSFTYCGTPRTCTVCKNTYHNPTEHNWTAATCTTRATCTICKSTYGSLAAHKWEGPTCSAPKTCTVCKATEGSKVDHLWKVTGCETNMVCIYCNKKGEFFEHNWMYGTPQTCRDCGIIFCDYYGHSFSVDVECRLTTCNVYDPEMLALADSILSEILTKDMSEFQKVKAIHDYIVNTTEYDYENYLNDTVPGTSYTAKGPLVYGTGVCAGYSGIFKFLCDRAGINCVEISGSSYTGEGHAWNQVQIDGKWYNIDVCWDDPVSSRPLLRYDYFLLSDGAFYVDHVPLQIVQTLYTCDANYPRDELYEE